MSGMETGPMFSLIPLLFVLQTATPPQFTCISSINGQAVKSRCGEPFDNLTRDQHRVTVFAPLLTLEIAYQCKGPSSVRVQTQPFALTVDVRELQDGVWQSRAVGRVEWDDHDSLLVANFPRLGGGCTSEKGFSLNRQERHMPTRGIQHWDHPPPSHGRSG